MIYILSTNNDFFYFIFEGEQEILKYGNVAEPELLSSSFEHRGTEHSVNNQANPLLSMLSNLGMNVGEINPTAVPSNNEMQHVRSSVDRHASDMNMKHLLSRGVNVISAEELEKQLRSSDRNDGITLTSTKSFPASEDSAILHSSAFVQRAPGLIHPPPGFIPPVADTSLNSIPSNIVSSTFPQFGIVGMPPPVFSSSSVHSQPQLVMPQVNNLSTGFSASEGLQSNFLPMGNISNGHFIHSSPFGLGLPIGGLGHMIGKQHVSDASLPPTKEVSHSNANYMLPTGHFIPAQQQTPRANNDVHAHAGSPNSSSLSFSLPVESLFSTSNPQVHTLSGNSHATTISAPWPPNRD